MNLRQEIVGALIITGSFAALLAVAEYWTRYGKPRPEWTRKLVHLGGGLLCLLFPLLVESPWTVLVLGLGMSALFAIGHRVNRLRSLHGVQRSTRGSEYYPLGIFLAFWFAEGEAWLFISSVLVLAVADAGAALIGGRYGSIRYTVEHDTKSLEGSAVFLIIAFLAMHLTMLLLTDLPRETCVLAALTVGLLLTGLEAISLSGADNLFVPVGACLILKKLAAKPVPEVLYQTASLIGMCLLVGLLARRTRASNTGGNIAFLLFAYASWSLGSEEWALPVLLAWVAFVVAPECLFAPERGLRVVRVRLLVRVLVIPFVLLLAANVTGSYHFVYGPFLAAVTATFIVSLWRRLRERFELTRTRKFGAAVSVALLAWAVTSLFPWIVQRERAWPALAVMLAVSLGVALANAGLRRDRLALTPSAEPQDLPAQTWDRLSWLLTASAALVVMALQRAQLIGVWRPGEESLILRP